MTSVVAKACGSTSSPMPAISVPEKGNRNKRKFRADPPLADPTKAIPLPSNEYTSFEFSAERFEIHRHTTGCNMCCVNHDISDALKLDLGLSCALGTSKLGVREPREEIEASGDQFHDTDWNDLTESELEDLVLRNLDAIFKSAIKKIVASGYSEEVATKAILRSGLWYGCKDTLSNIVDNTLVFLRSGLEIDPSREHYFDDLPQIAKYILAELVCLLREVRPFFSTGDAMWCLLICDMNVSHACAMESDHFCSFLRDTTLNINSSVSALPQLRAELKSFECNSSVPCETIKSVAYARNCPPEPPNLASIHGEHRLQSDISKITDDPNSKPTLALKGKIPDKDCHSSMTISTEKSFNATGITHTASAEKFAGSRKVPGIMKRVNILHPKSMHFEKHYRPNGSRSTSRAGKLSKFSGLVSDKKFKGLADPTVLNAWNPLFKNNKVIGFDIPAGNFSSTTELTSGPTFGLETMGRNSSLAKSSFSSTLPMLPVNSSHSLPADTELSLSFSAKTVVDPTPFSYNIDSAGSSFLGSTSNNSLGLRTPQDKKDEIIKKMVPRVRELQNQLQEWTAWANQKVMQAARRLSKDKAELKTLRQENDEVERLKKEKQTLEESTMKKLSEMENALFKASGQLERANAAVRRLEVENVTLRREMEAAKLHAAESAASCQEVSKREKNTLMKFQSWEKQKTIFQEELSAEKWKLMQTLEKLQQAKEVQDRVEAKVILEMKAKEELFMRISSLRKEREQIEASTQSKEDMIKLRAEINLHKHKQDIERLEKDISQLRLKSDLSKIAALRRGIDGNHAGKTTNFRQRSTMSYISSMATIPDLTGYGNVKRERECVMCLCEEMCVVFLPCAHQVVCTMCNELHERQGMRDCPSCRGPIQRRICVRYAHC